MQNGQPVKLDYFILNGCVKSYHTDDEGKIHIIQFGMQDWWITDYQAYYNQTTATMDIDCIEDTEALCLSYENGKNYVLKCIRSNIFSGKNQYPQCCIAATHSFADQQQCKRTI
ncbi:hypothetical protein KRR40_06945 [Niabella defluvii]|nr:hypothetical protein KRR40_06945 [Niabella sp. I65]